MVQEAAESVNHVNGLLTALLALGSTVGAIAQAMAKLPKPSESSPVWYARVYPWLNLVAGNWGNAKNAK